MKILSANIKCKLNNILLTTYLFFRLFIKFKVICIKVHSLYIKLSLKLINVLQNEKLKYLYNFQTL